VPRHATRLVQEGQCDGANCGRGIREGPYQRQITPLPAPKKDRSLALVCADATDYPETSYSSRALTSAKIQPIVGALVPICELRVQVPRLAHSRDEAARPDADVFTKPSLGVHYSSCDTHTIFIFPNRSPGRLSMLVVCGSCDRSWRLPVERSLYMLLDVAAHPCPFCEAYLLACPEDGAFETASGHVRSMPRRIDRRRAHHFFTLGQ